MKLSNLVLGATIAMVSGAVHAANVVCTVNDNGVASAVTQAAVTDATQDLTAEKGNYSYEVKVYDGKILFVAATDKTTGTRYQSTSVADASHYLDLEVTEKSGKVLVFQCSL